MVLDRVIGTTYLVGLATRAPRDLDLHQRETCQRMGGNEDEMVRLRPGDRSTAALPDGSEFLHRQ